MTDELVIVQEVAAAPLASAVSWPAIFGGAVVAMAVSLIFAVLGAGFAAGALAAWPNPGRWVRAASGASTSPRQRPTTFFRVTGRRHRSNFSEKIMRRST